jgi:hypothetical protein
MNRGQPARRDLDRRFKPIAAPANDASISELGSGRVPGELVVIPPLDGEVLKIGMSIVGGKLPWPTIIGAEVGSSGREPSTTMAAQGEAPANSKNARL